ncbi:tRNA (adenosine(37)-N6)-threonylcarbamoyltransferase complex transferase subunit TsaD [Candidatus Giovannonibacteria bacterium RIFCSPLOWO2_01_FULL_43_160]|uniref:tRNA N6-adenosine threonylcarbamoyltransferase n=2 Tax=Candidatus Giovannoniibacteriota TaxID=1752738 RepID=A0A0G1IXL8_9BACT|nr:MAG: putative tRNA threonylcarbamoyladenosine biosynthesis protein Gcp [Candidatus Giovannonibacteria bacterium GW2011_GWB1_43_13]KKS99745.1 MAG: putative tRNA threonylcarbamoyladenosine biosynthesis protein Gcp [Candidatus Giovannonibacteria bacterium GW2011_GWA1_43_15]KKT21160.1 MAG: putative tRNA threonylcarbamoyladenosine biosynthesis protein Gcp [Candidatus Giovannonibacteria bacterium GW2011_GWC2_43_8]KKT63830.1 MAG: putative tRNA threonylcarbamoyladenosine biosynthesis protein Gcp [Can
MKILAIETSCDETAIAVLEISEKQNSPKFNLLSNQVLSQIKIHKPFGGVVPNLAMREHRKNLPIILARVMKDVRRPLGRRTSKFNAIAVTSGPGLEPALWEGINFAKDLAKKWRVPLVPVNHLEGHIYASWLRRISPQFPLIALIVSGGHTELVLMKKHLDYKILGETRDDATGEAFDKVARMLKLGYPGGPLISKLAERLKTSGKGLFPRPMINSSDFDFSFSGLKTAVLYYLRDNPNADKSAVANEFQQAVVDVLVKKTGDALRKYKSKSLVVGGGVAANKKLRSALENMIKKSFPKISLYISPLWLCGDNAAMIAVAGYYRFKAKKFSKNPKTIRADGNLKL